VTNPYETPWYKIVDKDTGETIFVAQWQDQAHAISHTKRYAERKKLRLQLYVTEWSHVLDTDVQP
jgi:hypothetical protein